MTVTYSFKITSVNRLILYVDEDGNEFNDVITKINFYYEGVSDDGIKAIYNSSVSLAKPTVQAYKAFSQLTEADLVLWLETAIPESEINLMKMVIEKNIEEINTTSSLPWQT